MLVPPQIVARPGENGSPSGACEFSGSTMPGDGPYAVVAGRFYSRPAITELARTFGLLVSDTAAPKVERLVLEVAALRARVDSSAREAIDVSKARVELARELEVVTKERDRLAAELAETKSLTEIAREFSLTPAKGAK